MVTNISSKSELNSLASKLVSQSAQLKSVVGELKSILNGIPNYEDIDVVGAGSILASNVANIAADMDAVSRSIQSYIVEIEEFDKYDFDIEKESNEVLGGDGSPVVGGTNSGIVGAGAPMSSNEESNVVVQSKPTNGNVGTSTNANTSGNNVNTNNSGSASTSKPVRPSYSSVQDDNSSEAGNQTVDIDKNVNNSVSNLNKPIDKGSSNNNIPNIQHTDKNVSVNTNNNVGSSNDIPVVETPVVDNGNIDEQIPTDIIDDNFSDDWYVSDESGYIGQTNNNISSGVSTDTNSSNNGSAIPGILGGLGAAAVVGLGAVGGAKVIKNMKENQEIDDDDE